MTKLGQSTPVLRMLDEQKAREFYVGFLGFEVKWEHRFEDNFPLYMEISRDDCVIHLSEHHGDCSPGGAMRIPLDGVKHFCKDLLAQDYKFAKPSVQNTDWNTIEMSVTDPFGNRVTFFETIGK